MLLDSLIPSRIRKTRLISSLQFLAWNSSMTRLTYQSFRLLLNLEWLLLATAVFMEVLLPFQPSWAVLCRVVAIVIFGLMGLRLPSGKLGTKLLYTALEFGLILLPATQNGLSNRSVSPAVSSFSDAELSDFSAIGAVDCPGFIALDLRSPTFNKTRCDWKGRVCCLRLAIE